MDEFVRTKLGCFANSSYSNLPWWAIGYRWDHYNCQMLQFSLPDQGKTIMAVPCPFCGKVLKVSVPSIENSVKRQKRLRRTGNIFLLTPIVIFIANALILGTNNAGTWIETIYCGVFCLIIGIVLRRSKGTPTPIIKSSWRRHKLFDN
jgi:hypothetical protein